MEKSTTLPYDLGIEEDRNWDYFLIFVLFLIAWRFFLNI